MAAILDRTSSYKVAVQDGFWIVTLNDRTVSTHQTLAEALAFIAGRPVRHPKLT